MQEHFPTWTLEADTAVLRAEAVTLRLCPSHPARGLCNISCRGQLLAGLQPLQIAPQPSVPGGGEQVRELYVRNNDLIASYHSLPSRPFVTQLSWRGLACDPGGFLIEIILAVHTQLLDSRPLVRAVSTAASGEVLFGRAGGGSSQPLHWQRMTGATEFLEADVRVILFRLKREGVSYAEMVHPSDFEGATCERTATSSRLAYALFPQPLEKGVIRKARVRGGILPRQDDTRLADAWNRDFVVSEPPLTV